MQISKKENSLSLYIHIPFCNSKCFYCNFFSVKGEEEQKAKYKQALLDEIDKNKDLFSKYVINTIYIGGGTPSVMPNSFYDELFAKLKEVANIKPGAEITIEVNPCSVNESKIICYKQNGINRISIGLQASQKRLLKKVNRTASKKQFEQAMKIIKKHFSNVSIDLMLGLPYQRAYHVKNSVKFALKFKPTHLSVYGLIVEKGTPLSKKDNLLKHIPRDEMQVKMYDLVAKMLKKCDFERYEVSNFALKHDDMSYLSKHNKAYWDRDNYLGIGASAHSCINETRFNNPSNLEDYFAGKQQINKQKLTDEEIREEQIMLGIRTKWGVDKKICAQEDIDVMVRDEFIKEENGRIVATDKGYRVLNQIILKLI